MANSPEETEIFAATMKSTSKVFVADAARLVETESMSTVVDVGGANGDFVYALMAVNAGIRGIVFDLPHVTPIADEAARSAGLESKFAVVAGDFHKDAIPAGELPLLRLILHDWNDDDRLVILRNCRRAISNNGRLIIAERLLGEIGEPGLSSLMDLEMLVMLGGRERSLQEFDILLSQTGFKIKRTMPTSSSLVLIEADPV